MVPVQYPIFLSVVASLWLILPTDPGLVKLSCHYGYLLILYQLAWDGLANMMEMV
jgi:hypothetical protein